MSDYETGLEDQLRCCLGMNGGWAPALEDIVKEAKAVIARMDPTRAPQIVYEARGYLCAELKRRSSHFHGSQMAGEVGASIDVYRQACEALLAELSTDLAPLA